MLHISLLGEQAITDVATGTVRMRSSRSVALVAFLAVHAGTPQLRQRIAGSFWPDSTDAQALTNLRRELHHLRQVLAGEPSLVVTARDLCWCDTPTCRVDVRTFRTERDAAVAAARGDDHATAAAHATNAITQYQGDLLPGTYDDWVLEARAELERQCIELCDLACQKHTRTGDLSAAADAARRRIQLQPLAEAGYRTLMQLQADLGDRAGAVSTYHHCASVLDRELGLDPDEATRQTLQRLLDRTPQASEVPTPEPATASADSANRRGRSGRAAAELVGRGQQLTLLRSLWRTAAAGRPSLALVCGDAGVGKTRLVAEVAGIAQLQGAVVASTQCFGSAGRLALAPVADWLRNTAIQSATAMLDPIWQVEVGRLVPSSTTAISVPVGEPTIGSRALVDAWQRHRFFEGLARALISVGRPLLLVLDNLQWCDQETLAFLTFCLALTDDTPVLVAATLRNDALRGDNRSDRGEEPAVVDWTARMRATGMLTDLSLGPLELPDTTHLAEAITGRTLQPDDARALHEMTGGFPLYVVEAARTTVDLGSTALPAGDLTEVLRSRLEQVSPIVREVAGLAAAVGRNFTLDLLTEASDLDADTVARAIDELWRRRIVREFREGYDFSHDLLRDAAYTEVSPPRRWLLHRRLAQALELLHTGDTDAVSAQLAEQYARGGRGDRAVAYYRRAADVAASRFAHAEAIRLHKEALSIVLTLPEGRDRDRQELDVLESIAAPLNARYGYSSAELHQTLRRSITLAESLGRKDSAISGLIGLWTSQFVQGNFEDGHRTVTRALTLTDSGSKWRGPAHFAFGGSAMSLGRPAEALHHFDLGARFAGTAPLLSVGTRPDVHSTAWAAHAHWLLGHDAEAMSSCRAAIELAREIGHPYSLAVALAYGTITRQLCGDLPALRDTVGELRALCDRYGFAYYREWGLILDGWSQPIAAGTSGIELAQKGVRNLKAAGSFARMPYWLSLLADLSAKSGRRDTAAAILDAALIDGQARQDMWWLPEVMRQRAAYDDDATADARLRSASELAREQGSLALLQRCERTLRERGERGKRTVRERHGS